MEAADAFRAVYPPALLEDLARSNGSALVSFLTDPSEHERQYDFRLHIAFARRNGGLNADRLSRLRSKNWDAFFQARAELLTAYFLHHHARLSLEQIDPDTSRGTQGDSLHRLPDGCSLFVEVKAPVEEITEGGSFDNAPLIRQQLKNAYDQLPDGMPTLVVLFCSGFDASPARNGIGGGMDKALYGNPIMRVRIGVPNPPVEDSYIRNGFVQPGLHRRLSAVAVLEDVLRPGHPINYVLKVYHNPYATHPLPPSVFALFSQFTFDRNRREMVALTTGAALAQE